MTDYILYDSVYITSRKYKIIYMVQNKSAVWRREKQEAEITKVYKETLGYDR